MKRVLTTLVCMLLMLGSISAQEAKTPKLSRAKRQMAKACLLLESDKPEKGVKLMRKAARSGYAMAQYNLAICYRTALGVDYDIEEAAMWFRLAAEQGVTEAQNNLGALYLKGEGVEQNYEEAVKWYSMAAESGDAVAQYNLADCYYYGMGVEEDFDAAVMWDAKAATNGLAEAQYRLGEICLEVYEEYELAVELFTDASEQDYAPAQYYLSMCYGMGLGVDVDDEASVMWCLMAAEQGLDRAQYTMGIKHLYGYGVDEDYAMGVMWLRRAAEQGVVEAQETLDSLGESWSVVE